MQKLSEQVERKFIDSIDIDEWEIETDTGWEDISKIHKTIEYDVWKIQTSSGKDLECADNHIVFDEHYNEMFVKDCIPRKTFIYTKNGPELVISVSKTEKSENMYDIQVDSNNHRYYTNDILSHNTTTIVGYLLHHALFNENQKIAILANKGSLAREILGRLQTAYEHLPKWLQQGVTTWNKGTIELENGSKILATATSSSAIRGDSYNCLDGESKVTIRNKETGLIEQLSILELDQRLKNE